MKFTGIMKSKFDLNNTKINWEKVDRVIDGSTKSIESYGSP